MFHEYLEFKIQIGARTDDYYSVHVQGPGGDADGELRIPTDTPIYQRALKQITALETDEVSLVQLGHLLFEALFTPRIKELYARSQGMLTSNQGLRLVFEIATDNAVVAALPWEFLADPDHGPLAMLDAPMVRYLPTASTIPTLVTSLPLKVLLTGADTPPEVQVARELREIERALARFGDQVAVTVEPHLTPGILQERLQEGYDAWHFVGHGGMSTDGTTGFLLFESAYGGGERVSARELGILLHRCGVRLVVLNACQSAMLAVDPLRGIAPALIRAEIPAVIAMQLSVSDEGAREFAGAFYRALVTGYPIDACVTEGRKAIMLATGLGCPDWGIPVVYSRAPNGRLLETSTSASSIASITRKPIDDGLLALRVLMETPEVYAAVARGSDQFQQALRHIERLGFLKRLHDHLQQLEDCAQIVEADRRRLPQDLRAWGNLAQSEEELNGQIDVILRLADDGQPNAGWPKKLARAQGEARAAVEQGDLELLASAMNQIDDVLGVVPWSVNLRLVEVAAGLPLYTVARTLETVAARLDALHLDGWAARQYAVFVQAVKALDALDLRLGQLVRRHNLFQELEHELRQLEVGLALDGQNLVRSWPSLQMLHVQLCDDPTVPWAPKLTLTADLLNQSLTALTDQRAAMIFGRYRSQVGQSFNQVDADLLELCEELRRIGRSLEFVLRTVA